ncbi:DUF6415 family natural product biosynthesis protein [Streptomyces sp. NPDC005708]|uniref:DUF6415 family natural product biosynthesis protein n=1 Tax=Streptomyces sp. NPDC005708 TaxID=3154564 RepID=UPI0033FA49B2
MISTVDTKRDARKPDIETMREAVDRLLDPDAVPQALPPGFEELEALTLQLRGHFDLLMPEVDQLARKLARDSVPRYCVLACLGEARQKLAAAPSPAPGGDLRVRPPPGPCPQRLVRPLRGSRRGRAVKSITGLLLYVAAVTAPGSSPWCWRGRRVDAPP